MSSTGQPRVIADRFELREVIGKGGMAIVYRAWDRERGQACAVKIPTDNLSGDGEFRRRFRQETGAAVALVHPRIVRVYAHGEAGGTPYMAMELVDGGTLRDLLHRRGQLPEPLAVRLAAEVADALAYAHTRGVIHRDIKPHNILLTEDRHVKVADFGIARTLGDTSATKTGSVLGSTQYISPEQARGDQAGPASDQYSLGVVLYEALAGRLPFDEAENAVAMALKHINDAPVDLQSLRPELSVATVTLVRRMLAKSPEDRYATAADLATALRRIYVRFGREDSTGAATAVLPLPIGDPSTPMQAGGTAVLPAPNKKVRSRRGSGSSRGNAVPTILGARAAVSLTSFRGPLFGRREAERSAVFSSKHRKSGAAPRVALAVIGLLGVWMLAAAVYQATWSMPGAPVPWQARSRGAGQTQVPLVIGQTLPAAQRAAASQQLTVVVASSRQDTYVGAGVIVAQDPAAAAGIAKGGTIHVVVSQGSGVVPDLRGLSLDDARKLLGSAGLVLGGTQQAFDVTVAAGMIVSESPEASAHLAPHSPVALVVSEGPAETVAPGAPTGAAARSPDPTAAGAHSAPASTPSSTATTSWSPPAVVPNVTGVSLERALAALRAARLRPGQVNYTYNADLAAGFVIYQARVAGTAASANDAVDLLVSQGPAHPSQTAPSLRTPGQTQSSPTSP